MRLFNKKDQVVAGKYKESVACYVPDYVRHVLKVRLSDDYYGIITTIGIREIVFKLDMDYERTEEGKVLVYDNKKNFDIVNEYVGMLYSQDIRMQTGIGMMSKTKDFLDVAYKLIDEYFIKENLPQILEDVEIHHQKPVYNIKRIVPIGTWLHHGVEINGDTRYLPFNIIPNIVKACANRIRARMDEIYPYSYEWKVVSSPNKKRADYIRYWHYELPTYGGKES